MELKTLETKVKALLEKYPSARGNDMNLYGIYLEEYHPGLAAKPMAIGIAEIAYSRSVPNVESVGRTRRKLQKDYPELRPDEKAQQDIEEKEHEWRGYANETV